MYVSNHCPNVRHPSSTRTEQSDRHGLPRPCRKFPESPQPSVDDLNFRFRSANQENWPFRLQPSSGALPHTRVVLHEESNGVTPHERCEFYKFPIRFRTPTIPTGPVRACQSIVASAKHHTVRHSSYWHSKRQSTRPRWLDVVCVSD